MRTLSASILCGVAAILIAVSDAHASDCIAPALETERRSAALIFVGRVTGIRNHPSGVEVAFEVLHSWKERARRKLRLIAPLLTAGGGRFPEPGEILLVFAYRIAGRDLMRMSNPGPCSNNQPVLCTRPVLRTLGRPLVAHEPLPSARDAGSDEAPLSAHHACVPPPIPPAGAILDLPYGVELRNLTATILRSGALRGLVFDLWCHPGTTAVCDDALRASVRARLQAWTFKPAVLDGRAVAMDIQQVPWRSMPPGSPGAAPKDR